MLVDLGDTIVVEGFNINFKWDRDIIESIVQPDDITMIYIQPAFEEWKKYVKKRADQYTDKDIMRNCNWNFYTKSLSRFEPPAYPYHIVSDFQKHSFTYHKYQGDAQQKKVEAMLAGLDLKGTRILDMGCAEGMAGAYCLQQGAAEVIGVDVNWGFLEAARAQGLRTILADLNELVLTDMGQFDYILCFSLLHRLYNKEKVIAQIAAAGKQAIFELPINKKDDLTIERYDSVEGHSQRETQAWCPSRRILELWLNKYFSKAEDLGLSPIGYGDSSTRVVYRCTK